LTNPLDRDSLPQWKKDLWIMASDLIAMYVPGFENKYYSVQFSKMSSPDHYVGYHKDDKDVGPQYHLTCGSYTGAYLECYDKNDCSYGYYCTPYLFLKMDGRLGHYVRLTNFRGTHFTIVFFEMYNEQPPYYEEIFFPPQFLLQ